MNIIKKIHHSIVTILLKYSDYTFWRELMDDLIEALKIFRKYTNKYSPVWCCHDELHVAVNPEDVSEEDKNKLEKYGFYVNDYTEDFYSFRFGSC